MDSFEISVLTFSVKGVGFYGVTVAALAAGIFGIGWLIFVLRGFRHAILPEPPSRR